MLGVLALILPLGLAGAVSPMMFMEQTVILAGRDGRRAGVRYAVGAAATLLVVAGALLLFGRAISLPERPTLDVTLDFVIGGLLLAAGLFLRLRRPRPTPPREHRRSLMGPKRALGFGAFSMATNVTTIAFVIPGAKIIAASDLDDAGRVIALIVLVGLASIPAWLPVALTSMAPGPAAPALGALRAFIEQHGRETVVVVLIGLGILLIGHGLVGL